MSIDDFNPSLTSSATIAQVSRNPSNPLFNHYLFESIAVLVRSVCSSGNLAIIDMFEAGLFPPFQNVLAQV